MSDAERIGTKRGGGGSSCAFSFPPTRRISSNVCVVCDEYGSTFEAMGGRGGAEGLGAAHKLFASDDSRASCLAWAAKAVGLGEATGPDGLKYG